MKLLSIPLLSLMLISSACFGASVATEQQDIRTMRKEVLERLYKEEPGTRKEIRRAAGYGVFSNVGVNPGPVNTNSDTSAGDYFRSQSGGMSAV